MRTVALVLVVFVVLAGCSTVSPDAGDPDGQSDAALSPSSIPGIAADGTVDAATLSDATTAVAGNRRLRFHARFSNSRGVRNMTLVAGENRTRLLFRLDRSEQFVNDTTYAIRTDSSSRLVREDTTEHRVRLTGYVQSVARSVSLLNYSVAGTTTWRGSEVVELDATGGTGSAPEDLSGTVYVSPDGSVVHANLTSESTDTGVSFSLTEVGSATVETPDWVATARRAPNSHDGDGDDGNDHDDDRDDGDDGTDVDTLTRSSDYVNASVTLRGVPEDASTADVRLRPVATSADNPLVNATASHFFVVQYDGDFESATLRVRYDESAVPGAESDLRLYRLTNGGSVVVSDRVNADENVVVANTTALSGIFVVMDKPTYQRIQNQSSTTAANA